ncbi:MAG: excinuclease ABC subunit A [Omnitrophica bacterium GWA2_41_15]|nr:MAG: excinuclease ABC subunit A [Omnitrophica bacterium GWA2_41_15]HAZ10865.1 excinuclease ABC subunit UvrA [Candidatus Omnitrophota bacterium]
MEDKMIKIFGAKEHNLKNINLEIPRNKLVVITGLSGSGKSSLAFDTIYAEGQRRYVESLSSYARQFLEQLKKPDVEHIEGLSPAISIEQRKAGGNPRSTVGTATEIYDYLRLLFSRIGKPYCYKCGREIKQQSQDEIIDRILKYPDGSSILILAPLVRGRKGEYHSLFSELKKQGFVRIRLDGSVISLDEEIKLEKFKKHNIEVVVDRIVIEKSIRERLADSVETALKVGKGLMLVNKANREDELFSELYSCPECGINYEEIEPRMFSFNSPYGACHACDGLGTIMDIEADLVIPDKTKSLREAIRPWRVGGMRIVLHYRRLLRKLGQKYGFDIDTPFNKIPKNIKDVILYGSKSSDWGIHFEGIVPNLLRRLKDTDSEFMRAEINKYTSISTCPECKGKRLKPEALSIKIKGVSISDISGLSIRDAKKFFSNLKLTETEENIGRQILKEILERLSFMANVGLDYITLDRISSTLSGGEAQRIRLATQIGAGLVGVLYVLDEPSIGLHQRDNAKLLDTLKALRDMGNTLIVVEHDEATIRNADCIIDLGPGAGKHGGYIVAEGGIDDIINSKESLTGSYLRGELKINVPEKRRKTLKNKSIIIRNAKEHNLKNIDIEIPLGLFVCITGVSGSGKSTMVDDILYKALAKKLYGSKEKPGAHDEIDGADQIDKVIVVDQSPIGRTPRSNPVTYTGVFSFIRDIFTRLPESRMRGYKPGRFSFNVKGGRCEACQGDGIKQIEMHFLPDVYVTCEVCNGRRYNHETLQVLYKGKSIADVLEMTVEDGMELFKNIPHIHQKLKTLCEVGLGYIELGQSATTLSGGEAQRVKLATELSKIGTGKTLYILDEPTTGLHFADIDRLLKVLHALIEGGNSILIIEHNLDVIKSADYIIDLGPGGGDEGGKIVACGTPEEIVKVNSSYTGQYLKEYLKP